MSEIKISNASVSYSDIQTALIYSSNIQKSLDKQIELAKELQKNEKEEQEWYRQGPLKKLIYTILNKYFGMDLTPELVKEQEALRQELRKQQSLVNRATAKITDIIKKMEYVEYIHLNKAQTLDMNIADKYEISTPARFRKILLERYDNDYNRAMALNKTPIKTSHECEMEANNVDGQKIKDDVLRFAKSLQIDIETGERKETGGKYSQSYSAEINGQVFKGDLYNPKDTSELQQALLLEARKVDIMLNRQYKDIIPQISILQDKAKEAGGVLQISQDGVLSLSYTDNKGDERVPYSVKLDEEKDVFFEECMTNIENMSLEINNHVFEEETPVTLHFESDGPGIATALDLFEKEDYAQAIEDDPLDIDNDYLYDFDDYDDYDDR